MPEHLVPRRKPLRLQQFDYTSRQPYFVTVCTHDRKPLFVDHRMGVAVPDCILEGARETAFAVLAVCVMPDHWHALVMPLRGDNTLGDMVRSAKGKTTTRLRALGATGRIWQRQFYDHVVRGEEDLRQVAEYIVNNPVRKGLVAAAADYPLAKIFPEAFPP